MRYALVTPARDEARNLERLASCLQAQTIAPEEWVIVDDGSTDGTTWIAAELAAKHSWIRLIESPGATGSGPVAAGRRSGRDIVAFTFGVAQLARTPDVVVKLDADVSFEPDYFERVLRAFDADPTLGIAGGTCYEEDNGRWRAYRVTGGHVRGATRTYRWPCFEDVSPIEERIGWEAVEEARAGLNGWRTATLDDVAFYHHRALGSRDGARRAWIAQGHLAHYVGYRPTFMLLKIAFRLVREPAAVAMLWGYLEALVRREPRHADPAVRAFWRGRQGARHWPGRIREALGRPA